MGPLPLSRLYVTRQKVNKDCYSARSALASPNSVSRIYVNCSRNPFTVRVRCDRCALWFVLARQASLRGPVLRLAGAPPQPPNLPARSSPRARMETPNAAKQHPRLTHSINVSTAPQRWWCGGGSDQVRGKRAAHHSCASLALAQVD
jgi:hypothetical protein